MWGGFYEIDIDFSKLLWVQLLRYLLGFLFIIVLVVAAVTIKRKKAEKMRNLKNLQRVEGYFEEISNRILNLEDKAKF